jgi:HPt (histidine-containing phosphotransfer) domain-containing protein
MSGAIQKISRPAEDQSPRACPIDLVHLARQTLGDRSLEMELLSLFERQAGHVLDRIVAEPADRKTLADLGHTLRGSARAVGATRVAAAAMAFETAMTASTPDPVAADTARDELARAVKEARAAIREMLSDR